MDEDAGVKVLVPEKLEKLIPNSRATYPPYIRVPQAGSVWNADDKELLFFLTKVHLCLTGILLALVVFLAGSKLKRIRRSRQPCKVQIARPLLWEPQMNTTFRHMGKEQFPHPPKSLASVASSAVRTWAHHQPCPAPTDSEQVALINRSGTSSSPPPLPTPKLGTSCSDGRSSSLTEEESSQI